MTETTSCRSPPLDPYVRLSPHTAHERGILWERSISPTPRNLHRGQLCAFAGYLCTVSRPSPSGPSPWTWFYWVGTRRLTLRPVSPCPPLDPYLRPSLHTAE